MPSVMFAHLPFLSLPFHMTINQFIDHTISTET
jgi:hypothetical protein